MSDSYDAVVVGAGPNGLAAAIVCARAGLSVALFEGGKTVGGGARSAELTLPGFTHDVCSAIHPLALVSPLFQQLPLSQHGLAWDFPEVQLAHPLDDGRAALLLRSLEETAATLEGDGVTYAHMLRPFLQPSADGTHSYTAQHLYTDVLAPLRVPQHPLLFARFGLSAMQSTRGLARRAFSHEPARALFAGCGAHSFLSLDAAFSAAFSLILGISGHAVGWPCARGGSQKIADALADYFRSLGGSIFTDRPIASIDELPQARAYLFDVFPHALAQIAGNRLPPGYTKRLERFRHAPGVFKIDWALRNPIPWTAREVRKAGTVHLGGSLEEIALSERAASRGEPCAKPFVLLAQQSLFDPSRAPAGRHTAWAYCHVPFGSTADQTEAIEAQVERFAPGFRDCVLQRHTMSPKEYGAYNPNNLGGDIAGGNNNFSQLFFRPVISAVPYATPARDIFLCSASTPPGGGVHGMCGYFAARAALHRVFQKKTFLEENPR